MKKKLASVQTAPKQSGRSRRQIIRNERAVFAVKIKKGRCFGIAFSTDVADEQVLEMARDARSGEWRKIDAGSLSHDGDRYFGLMEVRHSEFDQDYCWLLGIRNSHDKTFPAGIVAGTQILVCDNLSFSGEVKLARKHSRFITRDLPRLVQSAVGRLMDRWHHQDTRFATYKLADLDDRTPHDLVIRACDVGVVPNRTIPEVLHEWREPRHEEFQPRTVWSLFNAFTEALKGNLVEPPRRTEALHGLLDNHVGLAAPLLS